jgi:hypothetical protein
MGHHRRLWHGISPLQVLGFLEICG